MIESSSNATSFILCGFYLQEVELCRVLCNAAALHIADKFCWRV